MSHESIAQKASDMTYTGAAVIAASASPKFFGMSLDEWSLVGIFFGMLMAFAGFCANVYFKRAHLKLAEKLAKPDEDE